MQAQGGRKVVAVINPIDGPDYTGVDTTALCMPHLLAAGVRNIGYIYTSYGKRDISAMIRDVDTYRSQVLPPP